MNINSENQAIISKGKALQISLRKNEHIYYILDYNEKMHPALFLQLEDGRLLLYSICLGLNLSLATLQKPFIEHLFSMKNEGLHVFQVTSESIKEL